MQHMCRWKSFLTLFLCSCMFSLAVLLIPSFNFSWQKVNTHISQDVKAISYNCHFGSADTTTVGNVFVCTNICTGQLSVISFFSYGKVNMEMSTDCSEQWRSNGAVGFLLFCVHKRLKSLGCDTPTHNACSDLFALCWKSLLSKRLLKVEKIPHSQDKCYFGTTSSCIPW